MRNLSIFSASLAVDVQLFVSSEQTRYYLNGFALQPPGVEGAYIVATDGHRMGIFHDPAAIVADACIVKLSKDFLKACKARTTAPLFVYVDHDSQVAYLAGRDIDSPIPEDLNKLPGLTTICPAVLIDGSFPDWSRVCPSGVDFGLATTAVQGFNPKYLGDFASLTKHGGIVVRSEGAGYPAYVFVDSRKDFVGVLMPVRVTHDCLPGWMFARAEQPVSQAAE